jgi:integrase/recombinase XerD
MSADENPRTLTEAEFTKLLDYAEQTRQPVRSRVIILLSFQAGLSASEIASLRWQNCITIQGGISDHLVITDDVARKNDHAGKRIPLDLDLRLALADLYMISDDRSPNVPVILTKRQKHGLLTRAIVEWFRAVYADLGLEGCSSDTGRRTFLEKKRRVYIEDLQHGAVAQKWVPQNPSMYLLKSD